MSKEEEVKEEVPVADQPSAEPLPSVERSESMIDELNKAVDRAEAANKVTAELLTRQEALKVQEKLGGQASAGVPQVSEEERKNAEAKKLLEGTGFEDMFDNASD